MFCTQCHYLLLLQVLRFSTLPCEVKQLQQLFHIICEYKHKLHSIQRKYKFVAVSLNAQGTKYLAWRWRKYIAYILAYIIAC